MYLDVHIAETIVEKLEAIQHFPVSITDRDGIILASTDPKRVGCQDSAAKEYLQNQFTAINLQKAVIRAGRAVTHMTVRHRIVGAVLVEHITAADRTHLDMIKTVAELIAEQNQLREEKKNAPASLEDMLSILVGIHPAEGQPVIEELEKMGFDFSVSRISLLIQCKKKNVFENPRANRKLVLSEKQYLHSAEQFLEQIPSYFPGQHDFVLTDCSEQNAVVLTAGRNASQEVNALYLFELCNKFVEIAEKNYNLDLYAVVGTWCRDFLDYERQYEQLMLRLASGKLLFPDRKVFLGNSIVLGNFVTHTAKRVLQNVVSYVYGKLLRSKTRDILLQTLQVYFECDFNLTETSQRLFIHRNTLQHRLNKIEELTGFSVHTADGILTLRLAMLCYNSILAEEE